MKCFVCREELGPKAWFCSVCGCPVDSDGRGEARRCGSAFQIPASLDAEACVYRVSDVGVAPDAKRGAVATESVPSGTVHLLHPAADQAGQSNLARACKTPYVWMECHGEDAQIFPFESVQKTDAAKADVVADSFVPAPVEIGASVLPKKPAVKWVVSIFAMFCGVFVALIGIGAGAWLMLTRSSVPAASPVSVAMPQVQQVPQPFRGPGNDEVMMGPFPAGGAYAERKAVQPEKSYEEERLVPAKPAKRGVSPEDAAYIRKMNRQLEEQLKEMQMRK